MFLESLISKRKPNERKQKRIKQATDENWSLVLFYRFEFS